MRFLLLILSLFLQFNVSGYNINSPQENHANKILTPENEDFNERSCILFRYYSPDEGMYISQDPIRLYGERCSLYSYVANVNNGIDVFGLIGSYSSLSRQNRGNSNVEVHHIPPRAAVAANGKPEYGTPAIAMSAEDHAKTAASSAGRQDYIDKQEASIRNTGSYYEAMSRDITDVQGISRDYDDGIMEAIDYAEKKKMVTPEEAEKLRNQCQGS